MSWLIMSYHSTFPTARGTLKRHSGSKDEVYLVLGRSLHVLYVEPCSNIRQLHFEISSVRHKTLLVTSYHAVFVKCLVSLPSKNFKYFESIIDYM